MTISMMVEKQREDGQSPNYGITIYFLYNFIRLLVIFVALSQLSQLVMSVYHYVETPTSCDLTNFDSQGLLDTTIMVCYRILALHAPILSIVLLFWLSEEDIESTRFTEVKIVIV
jgi:hypothetical protein